MLAPCPFCDGTDSEDNACQMAAVEIHAFRSPIGKTAYRVDCSCGASGAPDLVWSKARELWNTRAITQRPADCGAWQPIEDYVPGNDNLNVLVVDQGVVSEAYYNGESDAWFKAGKSEHDFDFVSGDRLFPTLWQPMPKPPTSSAPSTTRGGEA